MSLTLHAGEIHVPRSDWLRGRRPPWTTMAAAAAGLVGALYPASASVIGPWGLPVVLVALALLVLSLRRPGVGVALAFVLTALTPGLVGQRAWLPGVGWTALLFLLLMLRPAGPVIGPTAALPPLCLPVVLYGATVLAAYAISPAPGLALPILRSTVTGILLFLVAAATLRAWSDITDVLLGTSGAAVLVGAFACLQYVLGVSSGIGFITSTGAIVDRATAGFNHPNLLGGFLVMLVPLTFAAVVLDRRWRLVHVAGMVLSLGGIYASFSRGSLLAVLLMPLLLLRGRWLLLLPPVAIVGFLVGVPSVMSERFALESQSGAEIAGRKDIWSTAGAIWMERPVLGNGLGSFAGTYSTVRVSGKQFLATTQFEPPPHAHNLELQLLAEQGVIGFSAFGAVAATAAWQARRLRQERWRAHALMGTALLACLVGMLVHNLFDVTLLENAGIQFWGILGILSAVVALANGGVGSDGS